MGATLIAHLLLALLARRAIKTGPRLILENQALLAQVTPDNPDAHFIFYVMAAWTKYSKAAAEIARILDAAFTRSWPDLPIRKWGWVEGGKGLLALHERRPEDAEAACRWIWDNAHRFAASGELLATANFIMARLRKRAGYYATSVEYGRAACAAFAAANLPYMAALSEITVSWALGQLGEQGEAKRLRDDASDCLNETEDYIALGMVHFARARDYSRSGFDGEALKEFERAAERLAPSSHNLRRVFMDAANIELRCSAKENVPAVAKYWSDCAKNKLNDAELLLQPNDPACARDGVRLCLARANEATRGVYRSLARARWFAKQAYECAHKINDQLMMARARYKQAEIELKYAMKEADDPWHVQQMARGFAIEALELARTLQNARLKARIFTLLGNISLEFPLHDHEAAHRQWEAACECMAQREDLDFLSAAITKLGRRLGAEEHGNITEAPLFVVTAARAFTQPLKKTMDEVEREIVFAVQAYTGNVPYAIAQKLQTGIDTVKKHLKSIDDLQVQPCVDHGDEVIYRLKAGTVFAQPLEKTMEDVEHAIFRAAWIRFGKDKLRSLLDIGHGRFVRLCGSMEDVTIKRGGV